MTDGMSVPEGYSLTDDMGSLWDRSRDLRAWHATKVI